MWWGQGVGRAEAEGGRKEGGTLRRQELTHHQNATLWACEVKLSHSQSRTLWGLQGDSIESK